MVRWFDGSLVQWFDGSLARWIFGLMVRWFDGSMNDWFDESLVCFVVRWLVGDTRRYLLDSELESADHKSC